MIKDGCCVNVAVRLPSILTHVKKKGAFIIYNHRIGVNLGWGKKLNVANMLPAVLLAIGAAYLPWNF